MSAPSPVPARLPEGGAHDSLTHALPVPFATWPARAVALLIDHAVISAAAFLSVGLLGYGRLSLHPGVTTSPYASGAGAPPPGWVVATLVLMALMQAYLGATPGKWVVGIAVVEARTGRPAGVVRTAVRTVAHLLDLILLLGYLRPLLDRERRTFADSIAGTYVIATRRPLPHPSLAWLAHGRGAPMGPRTGPPPWEEPAQPRWRVVAGVVVVVSVVLVIAFGCAPQDRARTALELAQAGSAGAPTGR